MISLNTNIPSLYGAMTFNRLSQEIDKVSRQLSTGKRIVSASDDPAGVGVLSTMKAQNASYDAVRRNIDSGMSLLDVASSSLETQQNILKQMKELATQASSNLLTADQRTALQSQFGELQVQMNTAVNRATIFGQNLTGASAANVSIQSGINAGDTFTLTASKSDAVTLGVDGATIDLNDSASASAAMTAIDTAVGEVANSQSIIGTQQTGLQSLMEVADTTQNNLKEGISRIEDADVAALTAQLYQLQTKQQLQLQMMSIMNQMPQSLLQLLK